MLLDNTADGDIEVADGLQISDEEYCRWNKVIDTVAVSEEVLRIINVIRKSLGSVTIAQTDERHNVYVSDRRWKKIVRLLRTSAFVHDRTEVTADDLLPSITVCGRSRRSARVSGPSSSVPCITT